MQTAIDKIRELRALHEDGLLSRQEFDQRKNAILDAAHAQPAAPDAPAAARGTELGLMAGQHIGPGNRRYRLERLIALGGMGQVWQATDLATHAELGHSAQVALKILSPELTESASHAKLLVQEATRARRLAHEHIVRVYDWAQDPATSSYFVIMECLAGEDLESLLAREGALPLARTLALLRPVAEALDYAWERHRLVHRDIKPGNVFVTARDEIKLLDFGIAARARAGGGTLTEAPALSGTPGYRAPEAGAPGVVPSRALDVYSVAVMVHQMLSGIATPASGEPARPTRLERQPVASLVQRPGPGSRSAAAERVGAARRVSLPRRRRRATPCPNRRRRQPARRRRSSTARQRRPTRPRNRRWKRPNSPATPPLQPPARPRASCCANSKSASAPKKTWCAARAAKRCANNWPHAATRKPPRRARPRTRPSARPLQAKAAAAYLAEQERVRAQPAPEEAAGAGHADRAADAAARPLHRRRRRGSGTGRAARRPLPDGLIRARAQDRDGVRRPEELAGARNAAALGRHRTALRHRPLPGHGRGVARLCRGQRLAAGRRGRLDRTRLRPDRRCIRWSASRGTTPNSMWPG